MAFEVVDMLYFEPMRREKAYNAWKNAKARCFDPNDPRYYTHGGRGITMCDEWAMSFDAFYEHIGSPMWGRNIILDRINNNGHYEPGNVRWTDGHTSMLNRNTYRNNTSGLKGLCYIKAMAKWQAKRTIDGVEYRKLFHDVEDAVEYLFDLEALVKTRLGCKE